MGGHGAITIALKNPSSWVSVSAFSPICNPTECPWGDKAFKAYLGSVEAGKAHDAACLLAHMDGPTGFDDILIDQGNSDEFLDKKQLLPERLVEAAKKSGQNVTLNMRDGFDHSYYFISSFIENHGERTSHTSVTSFFHHSFCHRRLSCMFYAYQSLFMDGAYGRGSLKCWCLRRHLTIFPPLQVNLFNAMRWWLEDPSSP